MWRITLFKVIYKKQKKKKSCCKLSFDRTTRQGFGNINDSADKSHKKTKKGNIWEQVLDLEALKIVIYFYTFKSQSCGFKIRCFIP